MSDHEERAKRLRQAIREALLKEWDPIGIADVPEARDEYDGYVASVYDLLEQRSPASKIFDYLWRLETQHMGSIGNWERTRQFAERLARMTEEMP